MRSVTTMMIIIAALFLFVGCPGVEEPPTQTGEGVVNWSIKKAMSAKDTKDYLALFAGHPQLERDMSEEKKLALLAGIKEEMNYHGIHLSRIQDIKLTPEHNSNPASYALKGTFNYSGPGVVGKTKVEVPEGGTGTIYAWAKQGKDGSWYLHKLAFELDVKTRRAALSTLEKAGR